MPITVAHEPSLAVVGTAAYAAGQGKREERDIRERDKYGAIYSRMALQAQLEREAQAVQVQQLRERMAAAQQEAAIGRQQQAERDMFMADVDRERREYDWGQRRAMYEEQSAARAKQDRQRQIMEGLREGSLRYTPAQKQANARDEAALSEIFSDSRFDEEQQQQLATVIRRRMASRFPGAVPFDERPIPLEEQLRMKIHNFDQVAHLPWSINSNGDAMLPRGYSQPEEKDPATVQAEREAEALEAYDKDFNRWEQVEKAKATWIEDNLGGQLLPSPQLRAKANALFPNIAMPRHPSLTLPVPSLEADMGLSPEGMELPTEPPLLPSEDVPRVRTQKEFDDLPPGALFMDTDGSIWRKP